jgi:hypothetical protein
MLLKAQKGNGITTVRLLNLGTRLGLVVNARLRPFYPPGQSPGTRCKRFCMSPQGRFGGIWRRQKLLLTPWFEPRTAQPVAISTTLCYLHVNYCRKLNVTDRQTEREGEVSNSECLKITTLTTATRRSEAPCCSAMCSEGPSMAVRAGPSVASYQRSFRRVPSSW